MRFSLASEHNLWQKTHRKLVQFLPILFTQPLQDTKSMTPDSITTLRASTQSSNKKRRLLTLHELKQQKTGVNVAPQQEYVEQSPPPKKSRPKKTLWARICLWLLGPVITVLLVLSTGIVYLTSPAGEELLTKIIVDGVNYLGKPMGLRIQLVGIRGFWDGKIQLYNLRVYDPYGPWLRIDEGTLHPQWSSLARGSLASWQHRQNHEISQSFKENHAPLATLPQNHESTFVHETEGVSTEEKVVIVPFGQEQHPENIDLVDDLLTAEQTLKNTVVIGLKLGTLVGMHMPRFPRYTLTEPEQESTEQMPLTFLPSWLALDIGEINIAEFQLGPTGRSITISARMHGQVSEKKLRLRTIFLAATEVSSQWVLPGVQDLPADVTLTLKQLSSLSQEITENLRAQGKETKNENFILSFASFDYDDGSIDLRWQNRDSFFTSLYLQGAKSIWSRARILANIDAWPPSETNPLQAKFITHFGMTLEQNDQQIKNSLASGQLFWNSKKLVLRDFDIASPAANPSFKAKGSLGLSASEGFGSQLQLSIDDVKTLAAVLGIDTSKETIGGALNADFYVSRGGDYLLWWAKPLPSFQEDRVLPGFKANPHDFSTVAKNVQNYSASVLNTLETVTTAYIHAGLVSLPSKAQAPSAIQASSEHAQQSTALDEVHENLEIIKHIPLPPASKNEEALRFRVKVEAPELILPQGSIKSVFFTIHGNSADIKDMPKGTAYWRKKELDGLTDFTASGLPRGLVGTTFLRLGNIFDMGVGTANAAWFVGGAHDESDVFQARLNNLNLTFPGITNKADLSFAYALPRLKRRWPWVDGNISLHIADWKLIERITDSPMRVENFALASAFKSFLDDNGDPAQYMNVNLSTDRIDATQFMVRKTVGTSESKHLHALADAIGLSIGKLRDALTRKMEYTPPADYPIFTAKLNLSAGRGGPVRWNNGAADVLVAGEKANFSVKMLGDINALLEGLFHFRTRTLSLKDMKISTPKKEK